MKKFLSLVFIVLITIMFSGCANSIDNIVPIGKNTYLYEGGCGGVSPLVRGASRFCAEQGKKIMVTKMYDKPCKEYIHFHCEYEDSSNYTKTHYESEADIKIDVK